MNALAAAVKHHVAVAQSKSAEYRRRAPDGEGEHHAFGGERKIGDTGQVFATPIHFQMLQLQSRQPGPEIAGTRYREVDAHFAEGGGVAIRIAEREGTAFCHVPVPSPADEFAVDRIFSSR